MTKTVRPMEHITTVITLTPQLLEWMDSHAGELVNVRINADLTVDFITIPAGIRAE